MWRICGIPGRKVHHFYSHIPCGMWHLPVMFDLIAMFHFYSHIPCGMWRERMLWTGRWKNFYSHIPCGMWLEQEETAKCTIAFLLTHPVWDVTLEEREVLLDKLHFYSHIPCGMWHNSCRHIMLTRYTFLLTHPVWDMTPRVPVAVLVAAISTHTSRVGCDLGVVITFSALNHFYSHIPCGMWHKFRLRQLMPFVISTHTSRVGCDWVHGNAKVFGNAISTHTSRVGCDWEPVEPHEHI